MGIVLFWLGHHGSQNRKRFIEHSSQYSTRWRQLFKAVRHALLVKSQLLSRNPYLYCHNSLIQVSNMHELSAIRDSKNFAFNLFGHTQMKTIVNVILCALN